jgi:hypothetical protein
LNSGEWPTITSFTEVAGEFWQGFSGSLHRSSN